MQPMHYSYTVPILKLKDCRVKSTSFDDFRGIAISPILSTVFEYCLLDRHGNFLTSSDVQFGFKKGLGWRNAIYRVYNIVNRFVELKSTVNICAFDLTKAFDKVNHRAMFMKLMKWHIPVDLLNILENWLSEFYVCVKWFASYSHEFKVISAVRQGTVLSLYLSAVYIDDIGKLCNAHLGLHVVLYAHLVTHLSGPCRVHKNPSLFF